MKSELLRVLLYWAETLMVLVVCPSVNPFVPRTLFQGGDMRRCEKNYEIGSRRKDGRGSKGSDRKCVEGSSGIREK